MQMTAKAWLEYISGMSSIDQKAVTLMQQWIDKHGTDDRASLIAYADALIQRYGQASGALACEMYEATAAAQGVTVPAAEMASLPSYEEVGKAINGTLKVNQKVPNTVGRLVKQVGADTTLKNAKRDGAQFAWVPHGDTCAFCIALASRGWQYMSKKALRNGHAEHIHVNCDCQYAIRFDGKSTVEGYDPEKYRDMYYGAEGKAPDDKINSMRRMQREQNKDQVNARKRDLYAEQNYRKDYGEPKTYDRITKKDVITYSVRQVESYSTPVYVSENAIIKPKALNTINQNTEAAMKEYGIPQSRKPTIVILSVDELPNDYGVYDACSNTIFFNQAITKKEVQKAAGGAKVIERHESWHAKQAENFRNSVGEINLDNHGEYVKWASNAAKKKLDKEGVTEDNASEISSYAEKKYKQGRYDEVEAEMMALRKG